MLFEWHTLDTVFNMRLLNTLSSGNCFGYHYCIYNVHGYEYWIQKMRVLLIFTILKRSIKLLNPENWSLSVSSLPVIIHQASIQFVNFVTSWANIRLIWDGMNQPVCIFIIKIHRNQIYFFCQLDTVTIAVVSSTISGG